MKQPIIALHLFGCPKQLLHQLLATNSLDAFTMDEIAGFTWHPMSLKRTA